MSTSTIVLASLVALCVASTATPADSAKCSAPPYRQFDFWLGDWDVYETGDATTPIARATVSRIAGGCGIHERYEQTDGLIGESILSFNGARQVWQQTWITNYGSLMVIEGRLRDGALTLEGDVHLANGSSLRQRITWKASGGAVRESAVMSKDGGNTWEPAFDVEFRQRR